MSPLPSGDVVLVAVTVDRADELWAQDASAMEPAMVALDDLLHELWDARGGAVVAGAGDGALVAFTDPAVALEAAVAAHRAVAATTWGTREPVRLRVGVHGGRVTARRGAYVGRDVHTVRRLADHADPGTVRVSEQLAHLPEVTRSGLPEVEVEGGAARATVTVRLFGPTRIEVAGRTVDRWPRPAARRVVALLALDPQRRRRRDDLVEQLFGHLQPSSASRALSKALSQARSVLDTDDAQGSLLEVDRDVVALAPQAVVEVDLHVTEERLRSAISGSADVEQVGALRAALVEVEPLLVDDVAEPWAETARQDLELLRLEAARTLAHETDDEQDWTRVLRLLPTDEEAAARLVTVLTAGGRVEEARRVHRDCVRALGELGLEPSPVLRSALDAAPAAATAPLPAVQGRDAELDALHARVMTASSATVVVAGDPGIGKTSVLRHLSARLRADGWRVVAATSSPGDHRLPFVALRSALHELGGPPAQGLVARLLAGDTTVRGPADAAEAGRLARELEAHLAARAPVALVLDDLQWADLSTRDAVARLASASAPEGWVVVAGWRVGEAEVALPELPSSAEVVVLGGLDDQDATRVARAHAPDAPERVVEEVVRRADGNPFFLIELARAAARSPQAGDVVLSERVLDVVVSRLRRLGSTAQQVAALLALAGDTGAPALLRGAGEKLGLDAAALAAGLDELLDEGVVQHTDDGVRIAHPLVREVVERGTNPLRRAQIHEALAAAVASSVGPGAARLLDEAAHRLAAWEAARLPETAAPAVRAALRAGELARVVAGHGVAVALLGEAVAVSAHLAEPARRRIADELDEGRLALARALNDLGRTEEARDVARALLDNAASARARAQAWWQLAYPSYQQGRLEEACEWYRRGLDDVQGDPVAGAVLTNALGWATIRGGDLSARSLLERSATVLEEAGDWGAAAAALDRWGASYNIPVVTRDSWERGLPVLDRALAAALRTHEAAELAVVQLHRAPALNGLGRPEEADAAIEQAFALARANGGSYVESVAHWSAAEMAEVRGELEQAIAHRDAEVALLVRLGNARNLAAAHDHRAQLFTRLGRESDAHAARVQAELVRSQGAGATV